MKNILIFLILSVFVGYYFYEHKPKFRKEIDTNIQKVIHKKSLLEKYPRKW